MTGRGVVRIVFIAAFAAALTACASAPPHPQYPDIHFTSEPPIGLAVSSVSLREDYVPSTAAPHVEHRFPVTPMHALENWAHDKLSPSGGPDRAVLDITDASVVEVALPRTAGITGLFTTDQSERYDMTVQATLNIVDPTGIVVRTATVRAARSQSVSEDVSPDQRDQTWYDMTKDITAAFDRQMESEIRNHFTGFVTN
ncbi:MAG: hypothetical protein KGL11_13180 [Alphaproteobacteria bacterium]|nr:hypothetical protein [Alphaproteobacteria bacterium]